MIGGRLADDEAFAFQNCLGIGLNAADEEGEHAHLFFLEELYALSNEKRDIG
jgi:hypothetical protein